MTTRLLRLVTLKARGSSRWLESQSFLFELRVELDRILGCQPLVLFWCSVCHNPFQNPFQPKHKQRRIYLRKFRIRKQPVVLDVTNDIFFTNSIMSMMMIIYSWGKKETNAAFHRAAIKVKTAKLSLNIKTKT